MTGPHHILVVDDDPMVRRFVVATLGRHGYGVHEADSGNDGLKRFSQVHADLSLVLTDVVMPGMSGPEMVERILTIDPGIRVMFMTGIAGSAHFPRAETKSYELIHKPFTSQALLESVRDCLANCR